MWIIFGMRATAPDGDPYPVDPVRGSKKLGYNTDVILNRQGENIGYYRKSWPCCPGPDGQTMDDGYPSRELVKTFDTEFGRVGLQTCFDMNFMDTCTQPSYQQLNALAISRRPYTTGMCHTEFDLVHSVALWLLVKGTSSTHSTPTLCFGRAPTAEECQSEATPSCTTTTLFQPDGAISLIPEGWFRPTIHRCVPP
jgi:hypothetical protein